ncbi:unnamed protein product [Arabis nemorensis]|uniref:DUF4283 domain-containing protein n=1 Tax=Arabis nemorensis TaxID=586526 RepID=A0A565CPL2_9BRAS|nr:unnamed protein product [Arabis nemorensis]
MPMLKLCFLVVFTEGTKCRFIVQAGVRVEEPVKQVLNSQEVEVWSLITWKLKWGMIFSDIKMKVSGNCEVSERSMMAIMGRNVFIEGLTLDGALIIDSVDDAEVKMGGLIKNSGWAMETVDYKDTSVPEEIRIIGFRFNKVEQLEKKFTQPRRFSMED